MNRSQKMRRYTLAIERHVYRIRINGMYRREALKVDIECRRWKGRRKHLPLSIQLAFNRQHARRKCR